MKKLIKILINICIVFLILYNVVLTFQKIINPYVIPNFFGYKNFIIFSGSMEKTLNIGDIIFIKNKSEINENDIISFREKDAIVTHRVIDIIEQNGNLFYKTKGDSNTTIDSRLVSKEEIEGVYCFKIARIGTIIMFLQSKQGIFLLLGIFVIIYIITNIDNNKNSKGKHSK